MLNSFKAHWRVYLMEAWGLGTFMVSAVLFTILVEHPDLPVRQTLEAQGLIRRAIIGLAMGLTAMGIIYSPWGKKSGAHLNPAVTLSFLRLGKINREDASFYILFQFIGGYVGVLLFQLFFYQWVSSPFVNYAVTIPGSWGVIGAFLLEALLSFLLFYTVLWTSNLGKIAPYTGVFVAIWLLLFIAFEAPYSGMSINPARTVASALPANLWNNLWIYFIAPPLGMLLAVELYTRFHHPEEKKVKCHMSGQKHDCKTYVE